MKTETQVKKALAETLQLKEMNRIHLNDRLRDDLQMDSMSSLMFLMKLEENIDGFFVDPETLEMKDLETVSSVIHYINLQVNTKSAHVY